jgi:hypothetical protein
MVWLFLIEGKMMKEEKKKEIKKFIIRNKLIIFKALISFSILLLLVLGFWFFAQFTYDILKYQLEKVFTPIISVTLYIVLAFNFVVISGIYFLKSLKVIKKVPWFFIITIF